MAKKSTLPTSTFKRSFKMLGAAARMAGKEAGRRVKETLTEKLEESAPEVVRLRVEQAKILAQNLSQLKGAAMKVGQLLSVDASDFLPPEALDVLSKLQSRADPVDYEFMVQVLDSELGPDKLQFIQGLGGPAVAAASIGQVYRAQLQGQEVALKVQYPGISDSIDSDLVILRKVVEPFLRVTGRDIELQETFDEIRLMLHLESDYEHERDCLVEYKNLVEGLGSEGSQYVIPRVYREFSTKKVLCMSWEQGVTLQEWMRQSPPTQDRLQMAEYILNLYILEFFKWRFVQTDPNFGNFLIREDPLQLVLLDFGSTKRYERPFVQSYIKLLQTFAKRDLNETIETATRFGLVDLRESQASKENLFHMLQVAMEPFSPERQPFAFKDEDYARRSREAVLRFVNGLKYSPPPRQILFLHRKLGGIFNLVKTLGVEMNLTPFWEQMIRIDEE